MNKIGVIAGDLRQNYISSFLQEANYSNELLYNFDVCQTYIVPVPFTRDGLYINSDFKDPMKITDFISNLKADDRIYSGNIPPDVCKTFDVIGVKYYDFMKDSNVVWENAYLTAEGLLCKIIESTPFSLKGKDAFIIGYGKCGSLIAGLLSCLCKNVYIYDHTPEHLYELKTNGYIPLKYTDIINYINKFQIIINTVPSKVLSAIHYETANKNCFFYEIASKPFGLSNDIMEEHNLKLFTCPGIPGKYSPETAGEIISNNIIEHLERNDEDEL